MATRAGSDGIGQEAPVSQVPTTDLRILFLIVRFCEAVDRGPSITPQALDAMLFGDGSDAPHLQGYFEHCSNGRSVLSRSNVRILDGIRVPCNGTLGDGGGTLYGPRRWRTSSCAFEDTFAWGELAAGQARQRLGDAEFER
ncbi:hypothetical protein HYH03_003389 [Edaphochlamys debaryana]|uniref:Peptidase M11 gametolysin domain-containing protein n=1 Tax=Edaphochlamys debaryana TaxID=47281 RepID=A0A836C491_9CHLO|nr:hypothetical protein HYH03_003389 [Edaphochlamys debaryana]|eukprot:KAG2498643.1 hypothetical protein HYH03_003389 [Edaphochlamys debaryana]